MLLKSIIYTVLALAFSASLFAADLSDPAFRKEVSKKFPSVQPENITATPIKGIYQISQDGVVGYITADGRYLLDGDIVDLDTEENLAEKARGEWRLSKLAQVSDSKMLIFAPEKTKHTLIVFTDVDCRYCRLMHSQLQDFLDAGIEVRYMFFPLDGPSSDSYKKAEAVWCSDDRKAALTRAKQGKSIAKDTDCDNPIDEQFALAWDVLKLRGTPSLITEDGRLLSLTQPMSTVIGQIISPAANAKE